MSCPDTKLLPCDPVVPLWYLVQDDAEIECVVESIPVGVQARCMCNGRAIYSYQFSQVDDLLSWARAKVADLEAQGWTRVYRWKASRKG